MRLFRTWLQGLGGGVLVAFLVVGFAPAAQADEVSDWNQAMLRAGLVGATSPLVMTRVAAIVHAAIFDAVNGIDRRYEPIYVATDGPAGASRRAAIAQAAYETLIVLYPLQKATFDARLAVAMASIAMQEGPAAIGAGVDWGKKAAKGVLTARSTDHFVPPPDIPNIFGNPTINGMWRSTSFDAAGNPLPGIGAQFAYMTPWTFDDPAQFHPPAPPLIGSAKYAAELQEVKSKGQNTSTTRTLDETIFSFFWNSGTASYLWNNAALSLVEGNDHGNDRSERGHSQSLVENARLFAMLNLAMADAGIACWEAKYDYMKWRPVSAIRVGGDPGWTTLIVTPNHPEYPSGHSCLSGAAGAVLAHEFGERTHFSVESDQMIGVVRSFKSFGSALEEVKNARIYAGIHFRSACDVGQDVGVAVAEHVLETAMQHRRRGR
jgi:hypothetical protein